MNPPRRRRPPVRNRLLRVAVLVLVALALAGFGARPVRAQNPGTSPPTLTLVSQTSWLPPTGTFQVVLQPHDLPSDARLTLGVYDKVVGTSALLDSLDPANLGRTLRANPPAVRLSDLPHDADGAVTLTLPVSAGTVPQGGVNLPQPGVWPYTVTATAADGTTLTTFVSHILTLPATSSGVAPLAVGVVASVAAPTRPAIDGQPYLSTDQTSRLSATMQALTAAPDLPLTVAVDPLTASLLAQGSAAPQLKALAGTLGAREVLDLPFVPLDLGSWVAGGLQGEIDRQYAAGRTTLTSTLALPKAPAGGPAVVDRTTTPAALSSLARHGIDHVVIPSDQLTTNRDDPTALTQTFLVAGASGEELPAVAADQGVADALHATSDPVLDGHLALAALAQLHDDATRAGTTAQGAAVVVPADLDPTSLATFLAGLSDTARTGGSDEAAPAVSPVRLDALYQVTNAATNGRRGATVVREYHADAPAALGSYRDQLLSTRSEVGGLANLLPDGAALIDPIDRLVLVSGSRDLTTGERGGELVVARQQVTATTGQIVVAPTQIITLTSRSGKIPLNLENRLQVPAEVRIVLTSPKLDFPEGQVITQTLAPATTTRLDLPVTTRASGAFPLNVEVRSQDGTLPVATTRYTVRSTAISGVGLVISIGAGLFLLVWWARHFRSTRRARRLVGSGHPSLQEPAGTDVPEGGQE